MQFLLQSHRAALTLVLLAGPAIAAAQTPAETFADVPRILETGRKVMVTEIDGRKTEGKVAEVTPMSITLLVRDRRGTQHRQVAHHAVRTINRTDSVWNGLLIGLGAGIVGSELFVRHNCGPRGYDDECAAIASLVGWATFVPGGAVVGVLIDKFSGNKLVYQVPAERTKWSIAPVVGWRKGAVAITVGF